MINRHTAPFIPLPLLLLSSSSLPFPPSPPPSAFTNKQTKERRKATITTIETSFFLCGHIIANCRQDVATKHNAKQKVGKKEKEKEKGKGKGDQHHERCGATLGMKSRNSGASYSALKSSCCLVGSPHDARNSSIIWAAVFLGGEAGLGASTAAAAAALSLSRAALRSADRVGAGCSSMY